MYEQRRDGGAPLRRPRVDAWALAATRAPSLLGLSFRIPEVRALPGPSSTGAGAFAPPRQPRCRSHDLARLAVATTRGRRVPQRFHVVASLLVLGRHATHGAAIAWRAGAQLIDDVYVLILHCAVADAAQRRQLSVC